MNLEQHAKLCEQVSGFKQHVIDSINAKHVAFTEEILAWKENLLSNFQTQFQRLEELLSGPYNRELMWEWVVDERQFNDVAEFLSNRRVRLRDFPTLEMSGREYFRKYARGELGILKVLEASGFFTPPATRFYLPFCRQLIEGQKALLRLEETALIVVPENQVDLAFSKAQELVATDHRLQLYCPLGIPVHRIDKEFYINVVNSLAGLPYRVVRPLSDCEQREAALIRRLLKGTEETLSPLAEMESVHTNLASLNCGDLCAGVYLQLVEEHQKRIAKLEKAICESSI